jgi:hypothetical protein
VDGPADVQPGSNPGNPDAAVDMTGRSIFVWDDTPSINRKEVFLRIFPADGSAPGDPIQVNTFIEGAESETEVVLHEDGRVLVIWKDVEGSGDGTEIRGRLFSPELVAQGADFRINTLIAGDSSEPKVAAYGQGGFFVVWESTTSVGDDNEPNSIEGRFVTGRDQFAGPQFLVNEWTPKSQQNPGIGGKNGRIAVGWDSQSNAEFSGSTINGQFWSICGIFCDSFEGE